MLGDEWSGGWMSFDDHVTFQPRTTKLFLLAHVKQGLTVFSQNHDIVKNGHRLLPVVLRTQQRGCSRKTQE